MSPIATEHQPCEATMDGIEAQLAGDPLSAVPRSSARRPRRAAKDSRLFWYPRRPAEWLAQTRSLSVAAHGAYDRMRNHQFVNGPIPDDDEKIARIVGVAVDAWKELRPEVAELFDAEDGYLICPDMEAKKRDAIEAFEKSSENGRKGGSKSAAIRAGG